MRLKRSGFSLVLSLTIMASMVMMVIVLASFLQVESRLAQSHAGYLRARYNALASAKIAIGQLQVLAGPDQRVTMRADMYSLDTGPGLTTTGTVAKSANPSSPATGRLSHQKRYLTGVWATGGVQSDMARDWKVTDPSDSRLFLGWLSSPNKIDAADPEIADAVATGSYPGLPNYLPNRDYFERDPSSANFGKVIKNDGQALIDSLALTVADKPLEVLVPLVSGGTVSWPTNADKSRPLQEYHGAIDALPIPLPGPINSNNRPLGANGRYAFWVGDEGLKAKSNLPDAYGTNTSNNTQVAGLTPWEKGFSASTTQRSALESIASTDVANRPLGTFPADFLKWRNADVTSAASWDKLRLPGSINNPAISLWAMLQGGSSAAGDTLNTAMKALWHDVTPWSYSTLTDTLNGGPKTDLSTAFELPYAVYRGLELYDGQKNSDITKDKPDRRQALFHAAEGPTDFDFNRPNLLDTIGDPSDLLLASPKASEWAPRYTQSLFSTTFKKIYDQNGEETPDRQGFAYEVPLRSHFFNQTRLDSTLSLKTASTGYNQRYWALPYSGLRPDHVDNLNSRIIRGPTWDLYRNYYRMYKREIEAAGSANSNALRGQGGPKPVAGKPDAYVARGVEPLTYATGIRRVPVQRTGPPSGESNNPSMGAFPKPDKFFDGGGMATDYYARNNLADGSAGPEFQAEKPTLVPFNLGAPWDFSGIFSPTKTTDNTGYTGLAALVGNLGDDSYNYPRLPAPTTNNSISAETPNMRTTRTWPTAPSLRPTILRYSTVYSILRDGSQLGVTMDPIMVIHNPYDVPLEFEGITCESNMHSSPFRFIFQVNTALCNGPALSADPVWGVQPGGKYRSTESEYVDKINGRTAPRVTMGDKGLIKHEDIKNAPTTDTDVWRGPTTVTIGEAQVGGNENDNRAISFRIVAGGTTSRAVIRLEPGEIKVIATAGTTIGDSSNDKNTFIPADVGFNIVGKAFYKMTPFANVRYRNGNNRTDGTGQRVIWTMDFDLAQAFCAGTNSKGDPLPPSAVWDDPNKIRSLKDLWANIQSQRAIHDAFPSWDGSVQSLENIVGTGAITVYPRNEGWTNYNGYPVGSEGELWTQSVGSDGYLSSGVLNPPSYPQGMGKYVKPRLRNARLGTAGNQNWNFYLINKKSVRGGGTTALHTQRRWFGTPDNSTYYEGLETANGFNYVDESLLMNFQAMTTGWPMYGNSNNDDGYITATNQEWTRPPPFNKSPPEPDYTVIGTTNISTTIPQDPEFFGSKAFEGTVAKSRLFETNQFHTNGSLPVSRSGIPQQMLLFDFVRRSAEMTGDTTEWLPANKSSGGFGLNGTSSKVNLDLMQTPEEIRNAPMTPYFTSIRAMQDHLFGYDGKAHTPLGWVGTVRGLSGILGSGIKYSTTNGGEDSFWGSSVGPSGSSNVILFPIPRRPLLSLAQLGSVAFAQVNTDPDFTVGSSFAHPGIADLTKTTDWPGPKDLTPTESALPSEMQTIPELGYVAKAMGQRVVRNRSNVRTDHAFAANYALWDSFYFSGLNLNASSFSFKADVQPWPGGPDVPTDTNVAGAQSDALIKLTGDPLFDATSFSALKVALDAGKMPFANKRVTYLPDNKPANTLSYPSMAEFPHPSYLARTSLYNGGFNINSTSKAAWKAILNGLKGQPVPNADGTPNSTASGGTALTRFAAAFGSPDDKGDKPWTSYRELTEPEVDALAGKVVAEIRLRGPFMSLSDFVNRRLVNNDYGLKGALQAAIDKSGVNNNAIVKAGGTFTPPPVVVPSDPNSGYRNDLNPATAGPPTTWFKDTNAYPQIPGNRRFPSLRSMTGAAASPTVGAEVVAGLGAPGIITQMDVLNSIGPNLTARSDTFVVRAYGEALDNAGNSIGKAWIEVVVQRTTDYLAPVTKWKEYQEPTRRRLKYRNNGTTGVLKTNWDSLPVLDQFERTPFPADASQSEKDGLNLCRHFGRRFKATSLRWLNGSEI